ncbi:hypothetical protein I4L51_001458 [Enterococcus faecalis]|uniref:Uncharacterized protein n=1 Tax=Enterococcus faecalis ATCC 6055 TaxID=1169311 RepID=R3KCP7_ENTFL|nr:hypothetical protein [Enterococcus faecalis]EGO2589243.1 hypothetical protein [Enterococcus faecalis]EGS8054330.1 hypothetical protein [Enterococcus faecalis]EHM3050462.1 hypothetical protein [Enterococcus faecalis]EKZ0396429.1 hypothetical protein [Enterococcus faecalis]ELT9059519.1 hypothetical protein [Enterococcus faecalis]
MLTTLKVYKEGFNESIKIGESVDYAGDKYIVIRILEIKKLYFSKSVRLELRILVQKVGVTTNYNKYKKQAQVIEHYDQSKDNERMKKVGDIVILDKKIAYEVISINSIHYEFVDLVVEYTVQMVVPWSEQEINKALKEERKSTFKVLEGGK